MLHHAPYPTLPSPRGGKRINPRPLGKMNKIRIISFNAEGLSAAKLDLLANLRANVLCIQETHKDQSLPKIPGMKLIISHQSPIHGSAVYACEKTIIHKSKDLSEEGLEILQVEADTLNIISVYKPPPAPFSHPQINIPDNKPCLVVGDFNSHNTVWGYESTNHDGEAVEEWALVNNLSILYDAKDGTTFQSARWRRGYNPDLTFVSAKYHQLFFRTIMDPIPKSQHRPVAVDIRPVVQPRETKYQNPRSNYRKANWESFTYDIENKTPTIVPDPERYEDFQSLVIEAAKKNIPRGCRESYIPGLSDQNKEIYQEYTQAYKDDPFSENTMELGEDLISSLCQERSERWHETITNIDMTHNSKKAWNTIKKLNSEDQHPARIAAVTPNEVAHQLLINGKTNNQNRERGNLKKMKQDMQRIMSQSDDIFEPFTMNEFQSAMKHMKSGKAAGLDGIAVEMLLHFGDKARSWLLALFNKCASTYRIPRIWRRARVVALLKPGKDPSSPKSYRPISLLCITYKLYERMIMSRLAPTIEEQLTSDQAGFRPGRSCCSQVLNLTQFIEDGFENKQITGAVFVDLTAAYDTVNHRGLLFKVAQMTQNSTIVRIIESLLENRSFYVEMDGRKSRWRNQKNGLPQGSVLAPLLFNIYTNDLPQFQDIRRFIYADDLCIATQSRSFNIIGQRLTRALSSLSDYYKKWHLKANPMKTQVCSFHLNNHQANRKLKIKWENEELENHPHPVYLGVTLDRTLTFKEHVNKLKKKVATRNNLLSKIASTKWGADAKTLKQTALALSYSTAEYCAPVWERSSHAKKVDTELNKACRLITGTLRATPLPALYRLASIAPPDIRRDAIARNEKTKQANDPRHPLYNHRETRRRLKSRKSFMTVKELETHDLSKYRLQKWRERDTQTTNNALPNPSEDLPCGFSLIRRKWVTLNRGRAKVGRTGDNLQRWGYTNSAECSCGEPNQTMSHILRSCPIGPTCLDVDLKTANDTALQWVEKWCDKI